MYDDIVLPIFGPLSSSKSDPQSYFSNEVKLGTRNVSISINLEDGYLSNEIVNELISFFNNLMEIKKNLDKEILYDFRKGYEVNDYIDFHLENIDEEIETIIGKEKDLQKIKEKLLSKIQLDKIHIYPSNLEDYVVFDYSIEENTFNHVIVFTVNEQGSINSIGMES